jgi:hypothetical protein
VLHFDHQHDEQVAVQRQEQFGPGEHRSTGLAIHVQQDRARMACGHRLCQRGLAHLARPEHRHARVLLQSLLDGCLQVTRNHPVEFQF